MISKQHSNIACCIRRCLSPQLSIKFDILWEEVMVLYCLYYGLQSWLKALAFYKRDENLHETISTFSDVRT